MSGLLEDFGHLPILKWSAALMKTDQDTIESMIPLPTTWPEDIGAEDLESPMKDLGTGQDKAEEDTLQDKMDDEPDVVADS